MTKFNDAFWKWLGDSRVVDENGEPLVVYHATDNDFNSFDFKKLGASTRKNTKEKEALVLAKLGVWTNTQPLSEVLSTKQDMPLYLSIQNPYFTDFTELWSMTRDFSSGKKMREMFEADGYDGIQLVDHEFGGISFIAFEPTQIKSATGNDGTWDSDDPDITSNPTKEGTGYFGYMGVGHGKEGILWLWNEGNLEVSEAIHGDHDDIWEESHRHWRGRYDPAKKIISVISPDRAKLSVIPESLQEALQNKFETMDIREFNPQNDGTWDSDDPDIRSNPEYSGSHEAPVKGDVAAPLHDLTGIYPDDIYGPNAARYYGHYGDSQEDFEAIRLIQWAHNKPNNPINVYRAIPEGVSSKLNVGDWVTTVRKYAKEHGESTLEGKYKIVVMSVHPRDLWTDGNSIFEFGYDPQPPLPSRRVEARKKLDYRSASPDIRSNPRRRR